MYNWKRTLKNKRVAYSLKRKLYLPKAVTHYLAWKRSPGASPHTAPSSWSASDPWRRGPLRNPPPPTGKSEWPKWHPCPTRRGSAQSTWLTPPTRQNRKSSHSHNNPERTFSFPWLFISWLNIILLHLHIPCSNASPTLSWRVALSRRGYNWKTDQNWLLDIFMYH